VVRCLGVIYYQSYYSKNKRAHPIIPNKGPWAGREKGSSEDESAVLNVTLSKNICGVSEKGREWEKGKTQLS